MIDESVPTEKLLDVEWRGDALDLLPGWYDDWVVFERERLRQRLLHALEMLSLRLVRQGRFGEAVEAALLVHAEPLRESDLGVRPEAELTRLFAEYPNGSVGGEIP